VGCAYFFQSELVDGNLSGVQLISPDRLR
jgi:hypothetical protein